MDYKLPERIENSNKSTYGKVLNIAGSDYMSGAAYLSSMSALKVGCGYCFLSSTERALTAIAAQTKSVVFVPYKDLEKHLASCNVIEIGCGLSQSDEANSIFNKVLEHRDDNIPMLVDADGLNLLAKAPRSLKNTILTPHPKEASRLLGCPLEVVLNDFEGSAKKLSEKYNSIIVLKSHKTIVVAPDGRIYKNTTGNNAMAKAGSGDVLAGMISGFVAQGMDLFEASALGVYLHGLAGDLAKNELTEYSVLAEDLISYIPYAIKNLKTMQNND